MPHYLYGLVPPGATAPSEPGLGGAEVTVRPLNGHLAVLCSELDDSEVQPRRAHLTAHDRVLADAMATGAVLPLRFGTIANDDPSVVLEGMDAGTVAERLRALEGKVEVQVLWEPDEQAALERAVRRDPGLRERRIDAVDRGRRAMEAIADLAAEDLTAVVDEIRDLAVTTGPIELVGSSARVAVLVGRERFDEFQERCDGLAQRAASVGSLRTIGALPPYSFVDPPHTRAGA